MEIKIGEIRLQPARPYHTIEAEKPPENPFDGTMLVQVTQAANEGVAFTVLAYIAETVRDLAKIGSPPLTARAWMR